MPAALSWLNRAAAEDTDGLAAVFVGTGSFSTLQFDSAYPASNCLDPDPSLVSRVDFVESAAGASAFVIRAEWPADRAVRALAFLNCRLPAAVSSVQARVINAASSILETTASITAAQRVPIPGTTDRFNLYFLLSQDRSCNRAELRITLAASSSGYVEVGTMWAGPALVLPTTDSDWSSSSEDRSEVERGRGGALVAGRLPVLDEIDWPLTVLSYAQALGDPAAPTAPCIRSMRAEAGIGAPVLLIQRSDDVHAAQVLSAYAALTELPEIRHQSGDNYGTRIRARQIR